MNTSIEKKLRDKGVTITPMRMLVLQLLLQQQSAISLTEIEKNLAPSDRVTIYRTLKTFSEKGLVHQIDDGTGTPKFALCADACDSGSHHDLHVHFYCLHCKETFCLPDATFPGVDLPEKFTPSEMNLLVKGICSKCADCNTIA